MDSDEINEILAATNYRAALNNQIEHLKARFDEMNVLYWDGHAFDLTYEFMTYILASEVTIFLDRKREPVFISDTELEDFIHEAQQTHAEAITDYYDRYRKLMKARTAKEVIEAA